MNLATTSSTDKQGYSYDECSDGWKATCSVLPCFRDVQWPGYGTKTIEDKIDGQDVIIQLWKGTCQEFLGLSSFPGGIGAEVGIYQRHPDHASRPLPTGPLRTLLLAWNDLGGGGSPLWWPDSKLETEVSYKLTHPKTGKVFFEAGPEKTYWLCKWMSFSSYEKYKKDVVTDVPTSPLDYRLTYTINGKTYPAWD